MRRRFERASFRIVATEIVIRFFLREIAPQTNYGGEIWSRSPQLAMAC
jgi:hypothetical protein